MEASQAAGVRAEAFSRPSARQANMMLALLLVVLTCSAVDRSIVATLVEPIKHEFRLSDSQVGFLTGLAFALVNSVVLIPLGLLADRTNRRNLIAGALLLWSLMTALCGLAQNFVQLVLARMGVGAAEAGGQSSSLSMISDLFPPEKRATAVGIYYMAFPIGGMLAYGVGGLVAAAYGWRSALYIAAAPGFLLALLMLAVGREPPRESTPASQAKAKAPGLLEVLRFIATQKAMLHAMTAMAITTVSSAGQTMFVFSFYMRYHHMDLHRLGPILGLGQGVLGVTSLLIGGLLADRLGKRDPRKRLWVAAISLSAVAPVMLLAYVLPLGWSLALYFIQILLLNAWFGPAISEVQNLAPARMRSTVASIMYVLNGLVGYGLGPVVVGVLSDVLHRWAGAESLRYALLLVTWLWLWAALHHHLATRTLRAELARAAAYT